MVLIRSFIFFSTIKYKYKFICTIICITTILHSNTGSLSVSSSFCKKKEEEENHTQIEDIPNFDAGKDIFNEDELNFKGKKSVLQELNVPARNYFVS